MLDLILGFLDCGTSGTQGQVTLLLVGGAGVAVLGTTHAQSLLGSCPHAVLPSLVIMLPDVGKISLVDKNHLCLRTTDLIQIFPRAQIQDFL